MPTETISTVPNLAKVKGVHIDQPFSCLCRMEGTAILGTLTIEYQPKEALIELFSLEAWARSLATQRCFAEEVARLCFDECERALGDTPLRVIMHARTNVHAPVRALIEERWGP